MWLELNRKYDKGYREFLIYCSDLQYKNAFYKFQIQKKPLPVINYLTFPLKWTNRLTGTE